MSKINSNLECEICGRSDQTLVWTQTLDDGLTVHCEFCRKLMDSGLLRCIRLANEDGEIVAREYREWVMEWLPTDRGVVVHLKKGMPYEKEKLTPS